ncbi:MerR family transcriptional regulator [Antrihabitans cavernicola]|uniref:MerR family transcriptional regulator n=1 Tax=Antrihabitans cavernicola TaxID=2495913 RepID=A0A5A7S5Q8_9NOCA|nr:MerR family transcriptional regulator [Spelaeibacter cavernicola]KAA0018512.1 MerR family transcriptional regulator [Spelaeibacter cavernicola]
MRREDEQRQVGDVAKATGLTVRALHHYEELGLLSPSRDASGRRRYSSADLQQLHRVVALRGFGLSLAEIAATLSGSGPDPRELVRRQLEQNAERLATERRLRQRLMTLLDVLDRHAESSTVEFIDVIEEMLTMENSYSPEQLEQMAKQRRDLLERLTPEQLEQMNQQRREFLERLSPDELAELQRRRPGFERP